MPAPTRRKPRAIQDDEEVEQSDHQQDPSESQSPASDEPRSRSSAGPSLVNLKDPQPLAADQGLMIKQMITSYGSQKEYVQQALALLASSAEELAEFDTPAQGSQENDKIDDMDRGVRSLIDHEHETSARRKALETIKDQLEAQDKILDASERYQSNLQSDVEAFQTKTARQRYASNKRYLDFREAIWNASNESAMPPINDLIPAEVGDEEDSDDDLVMGGERQSYRCPLTGATLVNPVSSTTCSHSYTKEAVYEYLQNTTRKVCPATGCSASLSKSTLKDDKALAKKVATHRRREAERETLRRQTSNAVVLE